MSDKNNKIQVQRPINNGNRVKPEKWDGRFKSVEPLKNQKAAQPRQKRYQKWNHPATINWIMGQADPELRVMAARTLLGKCVPDLKAVEVKAQIEEKKVLDISRLTDNDLNTIERVLEHAVVEGDQIGEDEEILQGVYQEQLADD